MEPFVLEKADNGCELLALAPFTRAIRSCPPDLRHGLAALAEAISAA